MDRNDGDKMWMISILACGFGSNGDVESVQTVQSEPVGQVDKLEQVDVVKTVDTLNPSTEGEVVETVQGLVYFAKEPTCVKDCIVKVTRDSTKWTPEIAIETLYKGPTETEKGLRFISCESTGASVQSIENGIAKVQLTGGCSGCGTLSVYDLLVPTLKEFSTISVVQMYDPSGKSQIDSINEDSRPSCLEP